MDETRLRASLSHEPVTAEEKAEQDKKTYRFFAQESGVPE